MRVLHLTAYPVCVPRHGGQARVANIVDTYERAGVSTRVIAVYHADYYPRDTAGPHDLAVSGDELDRYIDVPLCTDVAAGEAAGAEPRVWTHVADQVVSFQPDVVQLEQPWLWPAVRRLRADGVGRPFRVIYSSQNLEAPLKARLLADRPADMETATTRIERLEREVVEAADLTIAVTEADGATYRAWGARQVMIAGNGIAERRADPARMERWRTQLRDRPFGLFVGSSHPPNVKGFWQMFGPSMAFLAPDQRILVVGGISACIFDAPQCREWDGINTSRVERAGELSEDDLAAVIALASCIVLPITVGGGSNIKTAEAIHSRRPVVGTTLSFRGFDDATGLPGIFRTDDPAEFRRLVKRALDGVMPAGGVERPDARRRVLWTETLKPLPAAIAAVVEGRGPSAH